MIPVIIEYLFPTSVQSVDSAWSLWTGLVRVLGCWRRLSVTKKVNTGTLRDGFPQQKSHVTVFVTVTTVHKNEMCLTVTKSIPVPGTFCEPTTCKPRV
jgi:hypothetical protein